MRFQTGDEITRSSNKSEYVSVIKRVLLLLLLFYQSTNKAQFHAQPKKKKISKLKFVLAFFHILSSSDWKNLCFSKTNGHTGVGG